MANGMYGMILVEPKAGLPKVDREFYIMQSEFYAKPVPGGHGLHQIDMDKGIEEKPTYVVFNGAVGSLTGDKALQAKVGERVRLFIGNGGPNLVSSFHVIGEIFDKVYSEGSPTTVKNDVQTTLVAPGGATMVDIKLNYPGKYLVVDHALSRVGKGLAGTLEVQGPRDASVYEALSESTGHQH
jgi:nitrite reductase (NO-forming)